MDGMSLPGLVLKAGACPRSNPERGYVAGVRQVTRRGLVQEDLDKRFFLQMATVHRHAAHGLRFQNPLLLLPSAPAPSPNPAPSLGSGSLLRCVPLSERQIDAFGQLLDIVC